MKSLVWRLIGALCALIVGLGMLIVALELTALHALGATDDSRPATGVYLLMFAGLAVVNLATFYALTHWSRYLREHPQTKQPPVVLSVGVLILAGSALVIGLTMHADWAESQSPPPSDPQWGFIANQVLWAAVAVGTLVLLAVRWSPGFRRRPIED